jgi:hypothetical protein
VYTSVRQRQKKIDVASSSPHHTPREKLISHR